MKTRNVWFALMLVCMAVGFVSCDDDETKDEVKVDASWLTGKWVVREFVPSSDLFVLYYTFDADGTYERLSSGPTINSVPVYGTYKVNVDNKQILLHNQTVGITEKYDIVMQTPEKMKWKGTTSECECKSMKFEKCEN